MKKFLQSVLLLLLMSGANSRGADRGGEIDLLPGDGIDSTPELPVRPQDGDVWSGFDGVGSGFDTEGSVKQPIGSIDQSPAANQAGDQTAELNNPTNTVAASSGIPADTAATSAAMNGVEAAPVGGVKKTPMQQQVDQIVESSRKDIATAQKPLEDKSFDFIRKPIESYIKFYADSTNNKAQKTLEYQNLTTEFSVNPALKPYLKVMKKYVQQLEALEELIKGEKDLKPTGIKAFKAKMNKLVKNINVSVKSFLKIQKAVEKKQKANEKKQELIQKKRDIVTLKKNLDVYDTNIKTFLDSFKTDSETRDSALVEKVDDFWNLIDTVAPTRADGTRDWPSSFTKAQKAQLQKMATNAKEIQDFKLIKSQIKDAEILFDKESVKDQQQKSKIDNINRTLDTLLSAAEKTKEPFKSVLIKEIAADRALLDQATKPMLDQQKVEAQKINDQVTKAIKNAEKAFEQGDYKSVKEDVVDLLNGKPVTGYRLEPQLSPVSRNKNENLIKELIKKYADEKQILRDQIQLYVDGTGDSESQRELQAARSKGLNELEAIREQLLKLLLPTELSTAQIPKPLSDTTSVSPQEQTPELNIMRQRKNGMFVMSDSAMRKSVESILHEYLSKRLGDKNIDFDVFRERPNEPNFSKQQNEKYGQYQNKILEIGRVNTQKPLSKELETQIKDAIQVQIKNIEALIDQALSKKTTTKVSTAS